MIIRHAKNEITKKTYFNTRNKAWEFLIENNITSYPLNLKKIVEENGWKVKDMKPYILQHPELRKFIKKNEGLTIKENNYYIILVNTSKSSVQRNRFTIAHEIGHIYLQHLKADEKTLETEANMFAARILMPMTLLEALNVTKAEEISKLCNVSLEASKHRLKRLNEIRERNKFNTSPLEQQVKKQLQDFIEGYKKYI